MKNRSVWVVEGWWRELWHRAEAWHATVGTALTRDDARKVLAQWRGRNPHDRFRLRRYEPVEGR